jgi:hypothetical protein
MALSSWSCLAAFMVPASAQSGKLVVIGAISMPVDLVEVYGDYAYLATGPTFSIVEVTNPSAPRLVGSFRFPERVWAFTVSGSFAYIAGDWLGLGVLDVSNPAAPRLRGSFKTVGQAWGVAVSGTRAIVANQMSGIDVVDVSDPDKPVPVGSYFTEGYARDVATSGSLVYVVDMPTGFSILDMSKGGQPTEVSTQQSAQSPLLVEVSQSPSSAAERVKVACVVAGRLLDITGGGRSVGLQIYDVSNPSTPMKVTTFKTPGQAMRVAMQGSLAYVADGPEGLQIVDLSDPSKPAIADSYKTVGPARDVAVNGPLVLIVVGETNKAADPRAGGPGVVILRRDP